MLRHARTAVYGAADWPYEFGVRHDCVTMARASLLSAIHARAGHRCTCVGSLLRIAGARPSRSVSSAPPRLKTRRSCPKRAPNSNARSSWNKPAIIATALEQFRDVGQVRMTPQVRFHIASCEEKLGRLVTALGGYQLAFADADSVGDDFKIRKSTPPSRAYKPAYPQARDRTRCTGAEAAEIQLDGVALGASSVGVAVPLDPGAAHSVSAKAPGALPFNADRDPSRRTSRRKSTIALEPRTGRGAALLSERNARHPRSRRPNQEARCRTSSAAWAMASLIGSGVLFGLRQSTLQ